MNHEVDLHVVIGAGPTGRSLAEALIAGGRPVRIVTRGGRVDGLSGIETLAADITDPDAARRACAGAQVVFGCLGLPDYRGWPEQWPPMMAGMLAGAADAGARFVFSDNLYMYGPVDGPLREDLPLTDYGTKPAVRAEITRMWQRAHTDGTVQAASVRPSDYFGPGVRNAMLGDYVTGAAVAGKTANLLGNPDMPHTFTYVPDVARALMTIGDAEEDAFGQAWHVPSSPARPVREVVELIYREVGRPARMRSAPPWMMTVLGLFDPNMKEAKEMLFQWTRPYEVDHSKFADRFYDDYTPLEDGIRETVAWYRAQG